MGMRSPPRRLSQSLLVCGTRAPGPPWSRALSPRPLAPGADKAGVGRLRLGQEGPLSDAHGLDAVVLGATRSIAAPLRRQPGLDLHLAQLGLAERRPAEGIALVMGQQVPNQDRDLAGRRDRSDLLPTPGFDAKEEGVERPGCRRGGPGGFDKQPACQRPALLGDAAMVCTTIARLT